MSGQDLRDPIRPEVGIVMGSASDGPTMRKCAATLDELGIPYEMKVCSAHRTPQRAHDFATTAADRGMKVIIAAAGMSAHLAGVMAALTHLPVLGVPMDGKLAGEGVEAAPDEPPSAFGQLRTYRIGQRQLGQLVGQHGGADSGVLVTPPEILDDVERGDGPSEP